MAGGLNKVTLIGNLGSDPEIRNMQSGDEIARFSVATTESWRDRNTQERQERTEWHRVVIFSRGLVPVVKNYLRKGSKVYLEGKLQTRKWQDQNVRDMYTTEVVLQGFNAQLIMLDGRGNDAARGDEAGNYSNRGFESHAKASSTDSTPSSAAPDDFDDEIPF